MLIFQLHVHVHVSLTHLPEDNSFIADTNFDLDLCSLDLIVDFCLVLLRSSLLDEESKQKNNSIFHH